ncbi:hypothetical protein ES703_65614 [subsurface metagenome]
MTSKSNEMFFRIIAFSKLETRRAPSTISSSGSLQRFTFLLKFPLKRKGSCETVAICFLKYFLSIFLISTPSSFIEPFCISYSRRRSFIIVVFPPPVYPIIPTFSPGSILKDTSFKVHSFSLYENQTLSNSILPLTMGFIGIIGLGILSSFPRIL